MYRKQKMGWFKKVYKIKPNTVGFLFRENKFEEKLEPGFHEISDFRNRTEVITLPTSSNFMTVVNQEVLSKDNVALRFSYIIIYKIIDGEKFLSKFALDKHISSLIYEAEQFIANSTQIFIRNKIAELESEFLNENRNELTDFKNQDLENEVSDFGITIEKAQLKDITFPKSIQDLFARQLEAKIRAKSDLENARTAVATARALKNASELMKDDDNIKFYQWMETITKIANKGKHTFMIGDIQQINKK
jgi:regulator of protease activity HflC (stomatin/prohibitin superfamily)